MREPLTPEQKFEIIKSHKHYISFRLRDAMGYYRKGDLLIAGSYWANSDRHLVKVKRAYPRSLVTECGIKFQQVGGVLENYDADTDRYTYLFDIDLTFNWLHLPLPLDEVLSYLQNLTGYQEFQYSASHYDWIVTCFEAKQSVESPALHFIVRKFPESELAPKELERINTYDAKEFAGCQLIKFEDVKSYQKSLVGV